MTFDTTMFAALKADISADSGQAFIDFRADVNSTAKAQAVADIYNAAASPDYFVYRTDVLTSEIFDQVTWGNYTPQDVIASDGTNAEVWIARSMACQGKQFNLQIMLQGISKFNAAKATWRGGLNDATTALPSGSAGASRSGGWTTILPILRRKATRAEKLYSVVSSGVGSNGADARGASTNPDVLILEGKLVYNDIQAAWFS